MTLIEEEYQGSSNRFLLVTAVPAWLVSMIIHILLVLALYSIVFDISDKDNRSLTIEDTADAEEIEELVIEEFEPVDIQQLEFDKPPEQLEEVVIAEEIVMSDFQEMEAATMQMDLVDFAADTAPFSDMMTEMAAASGNATSGRGQTTRTKMIVEGGGNDGSEASVVNGISWIANHQIKDGTWNFDHRQGAKKPGSSNFGSLKNAPRAATSMALLPFLGAGHTHKEGKYQNQVKAGLEALVRMVQYKGSRGSLSEPGGRMYSHGLGAITLCEAYAMTQDRTLLKPAQSAINHIVYAQDPVGGGWRYEPKEAGDTSVVGWQVMALKSAHMGYLEVPNNTVKGSIRFLDLVSVDGGANYGYAEPVGKRLGTTSVGLLCRMYLGWKKENPALIKGVQYLSKAGPSKNDMYYNYYATQVMRHYGGPEWQKWNTKMRDQLIATQVLPGKPEAGSWYFNSGHSAKGGRLFNTSLSVLTLEVYYRHLPIYKKGAADEEFPL